MSGHQSQAPAAVVRYFARFGVTEHPLIAQVYGPGPDGATCRWRQYPIRKRVSGSAVRKLRSEGITHIALSAGGHRADFTAAELSQRDGERRG